MKPLHIQTSQRGTKNLCFLVSVPQNDFRINYLIPFKVRLVVYVLKVLMRKQYSV